LTLRSLVLQREKKVQNKSVATRKSKSEGCFVFVLDFSPDLRQGQGFLAY
jgi:hypothetical protein